MACLLDRCQCGFTRITMRHAAGQLRYISKLCLIVVAPKNYALKAFHGSDLQLAPDADSSNLLHLVGPGVFAITLQIDQLSHTRFAEHVVTGSNANLETEVGHQAAQLI